MIGVELIGITLTGWVSLFVAVSAGIIGAMMFILGSERLHYVWGLFCLTVSVWAGAFFFSSQATDPITALYWTRIEYIGVILIPFTYFHYVLELTKKANRWIIGFLYAIGLMLVFINLSTSLIVTNVTFIFNELYYNHPPGPLHSYFLGLFILFVIIAHYLGYTAYRASNDLEFQQRTRLFFAVTGISFIGASMNFLSVYGIFIHPITNFTVAIAPPVIAYAMLRYHLFNMRVVVAQFLTLILSGFTLFQLVVVSKTSQEIVFNLLFFVVTLSVGIYLILNVRKEVEQRERIELLAKQLQIANDKLKELDRLKSEFLSIASHDLRTPITAIRNYVSLLLEGSFGKVPIGAEEGLRQVFTRSTDMTKLVDNYLNVSRIEQGRMKYDFVDADFTKIVQEATSFYRDGATKKGLRLTLTIKSGAEHLMAKLDTSKINEVINNLIDNSIKYTSSGSIDLTVEKVGNKARLTLKDTGVGMTQKTKDGLFKLFSPGEDSKRINPQSTGVGLYITKTHVEAHRGTLVAESEGQGKGSQFIIELALI